jgi:hypothetical protein
MEIYSYNDHRSAPFSRAWLVGFSNHQLYPGMGADVVMKSISLIIGHKVSTTLRAWLQPGVRVVAILRVAVGKRQRLWYRVLIRSLPGCRFLQSRGMVFGIALQFAHAQVVNSTQNSSQIATLHWYAANQTTTFSVGSNPAGMRSQHLPIA